MATELQPYSGRAKPCPKCRIYVGTEYHWAGGCWAPKTTLGRKSPCKDMDDLSDIEVSEHLCRVCQNCGFGWVEACADAQDDDECDDEQDDDEQGSEQ